MCVELCLCGWQIYIAHSLYITHAHVWAYQMAYSKINWSKDATQRSSHFRNFAAIDFISPRTFCRHLFALATRRCASVEIPRLEIERGDKVKSTRANFHCRKIINSMCTSTIVCNAFFHFSSAKKKKTIHRISARWQTLFDNIMQYARYHSDFHCAKCYLNALTSNGSECTH